MRRPSMMLITAPILATSILLLAMGSTAAWYVHELNKETSDLLTQNLQCTLAGERLVLGLRDVRLKMQGFLDSGDPATLPAIVAMRQRTRGQLDEAERSAPTDETRDLAARAWHNHDRFFAQLAMVQEMEPAAQKKNVRELTQMMTVDVLAPADDLLQRAQQAAGMHSQRHRTLTDRIGLGFLLLGTCGAVGGLLFGFGIAGGISRRIEQSEREASRAEQLAGVGQLAAGLAHELRNPLTAMRALVEAGSEQADGSGLDHRDLQVLDEEISRLERLVESFLDFARPPQPEKTEVDALLLVQQVLQVVGGRARQRGVTLACSEPARPIILLADPAQLRQVLLNVLLNAMDAVGEGGRVTVELGPQAAGPQGWIENLFPPTADRNAVKVSGPSYSQIHIGDNGPGVPDEMKEKIFEPFVSSKETGMGLGLAVSRRIVEAHGGQINVTDNPGGGARFSIRLPSVPVPTSCELPPCKLLDFCST